MHRWQQHIDEIKNRLQELTVQLDAWSNTDQVSALKTQLQSVEQTIQKLSKSAVEIPAELRDLKFRLLSELDQFKEVAKARKELEDLLLQYVQHKKANQKSAKKKAQKQKSIPSTGSRVALIDLIEAHILAPNTQLYRKYKEETYRAVLTPEGEIKLTLSGQTQYFDTPSGAARTITGRPTDGWVWWLVENDSIILDEYRKKYLNNETRR